MKTPKNNIITGAIAAILLSLVSCASTGSSGTTASSGVKPYTRDTCLVTGNKLGSMGDPVTIVHEGQQVIFCCKPCVGKFKANPQKYLSQL